VIPETADNRGDGGERRVVVVVGDGISGLYCARELARRAGYNVVVLEASDRSGDGSKRAISGPAPTGKSRSRPSSDRCDSS
jgi:monoamine oxidase